MSPENYVLRQRNLAGKHTPGRKTTANDGSYVSDEETEFITHLVGGMKDLTYATFHRRLRKLDQVH